MNVSARTRRTALAAACLAATLALAGCSKELTQVDADYVTPEGRATGRAVMLVYPDRPITITTWIDKADPLGASGTWNPSVPPDTAGDTFVSSAGPFYDSGQGVLHGIIIDGTPAGAYQVMRREANGGIRTMFDFPLQALRKWLDTGNEFYAFADPAPSPYVPPTYVGRGYVDGAIASASPVTNEGRLAGGSAATLPDIRYLDSPNTPGVLDIDGRLPEDSLFQVRWEPVAGAAGYWVQVFDYLPSASDFRRRLLGAPAPLAVDQVRDLFVAWCPPGVTSLRLGEPGGHTVLAYRPTSFRFGRGYNVRIAAVDADGGLVAMTLGAGSDDAFVRGSGVPGRIDVSPRGAAYVQPTRERPVRPGE
jgi:hypothetical protein